MASVGRSSRQPGVPRRAPCCPVSAAARCPTSLSCPAVSAFTLVASTMASAAPASPFKPTVLVGKVALVTGGGSGIGLEITRQLGGAAAACAPRMVVSERRTKASCVARVPCALQTCSNLCCLPGLHGAKVVISGRREQVHRLGCGGPLAAAARHSQHRLLPWRLELGFV